MSLADELQFAADKGDIKAFTLWRLPDGQFQANASQDGQSWRCVTRPNAVEAATKALKSLNDRPSKYLDGVSHSPRGEVDIFD